MLNTHNPRDKYGGVNNNGSNALHHQRMNPSNVSASTTSTPPPGVQRDKPQPSPDTATTAETAHTRLVIGGPTNNTTSVHSDTENNESRENTTGTTVVTNILKGDESTRTFVPHNRNVTGVPDSQLANPYASVRNFNSNNNTNINNNNNPNNDYNSINNSNNNNNNVYIPPPSDDNLESEPEKIDRNKHKNQKTAKAMITKIGMI